MKTLIIVLICSLVTIREATAQVISFSKLFFNETILVKYNEYGTADWRTTLERGTITSLTMWEDQYIIAINSADRMKILIYRISYRGRILGKFEVSDPQKPVGLFASTSARIAVDGKGNIYINYAQYQNPEGLGLAINHFEKYTLDGQKVWSRKANRPGVLSISDFYPVESGCIAFSSNGTPSSQEVHLFSDSEMPAFSQNEYQSSFGNLSWTKRSVSADDRVYYLRNNGNSKKGNELEIIDLIGDKSTTIVMKKEELEYVSHFVNLNWVQFPEALPRTC